MCKKKQHTKKEEDSQPRSMFSRQNLWAGLGWGYAVVGAIGYAIYYVCMGLFIPNTTDCVWISEHSRGIEIALSIVEKISDVLVIGAVLGFLSNAAQFLNIFKKDLESIVLDNRFLEKRNDIEDIWEHITLVLFKSRFRKISRELLALIRDNYFPKNQSIYYDKYTSNVTMDWEGDAEDEVIRVKTENKYTMVSENTEPIKIPWKSWTKDCDEYEIINHQIIVDGEIQRKKEDDNNIEDEKREGDELVFEVPILLSGQEQYEVEALLEKKFSFKKDFYRGYIASYIVNGMILSVTHPADLDLCLVERGTCKKFDIISKTETTLVARYNGLILPRQGYVLALKHK